MKNTLEDLIRLAIHFEGRTAFPVSEYDNRSLILLQSAANLLRAQRRNETNLYVSEKAYTLVKKAHDIFQDSPDQDIFALTKQCIRTAKELAYGKQLDSNLDDYGYDLVFAATLGSINTIMKEYVDKAAANIPSQAKYYLESIESGKIIYIEAPPETAKRLDELDLFSIPQDPAARTPQQQAALDEAYGKQMLAFGFRAAVGFPAQADMDDLLDFDTGETGNHTKVKYNLYFKEFSIIQFTTSRTSGYVYTRLTQSEAAQPWRFQFTVDLGLVGVSLPDLPQEIQKKINNIDPGQIFSISQLFMDLNTTALMNSPTITGATPEALYYLNTYFLGYTFQKLKETTGDVILGYSIIPESVPSDKPYLLTPKDFRFYVSPYRENSQPVPAKKKLYTLNYLVICEDKPFPELREIPWNWVEAGEYAHKNGAMAISKSHIYSFAQKEYVELVKNLLFNPIAEIHIDDPIYIKWKLGISQDQNTRPQFDADQTIHYSRSAQDSDTFVPIWGNIHLKYDLTAALRNYQTQDNQAVLECRVDTVSWLHFNVEGGVSEGNIYDKTTWYTLTIQVDEYGKLTLKPQYKEQDNGTTFSISGWSAFIAPGLEDTLKDVTNTINGHITQNKNTWDQAFLNKYNSNALWYLPGDSSLLFQQPAFSKHFDLTFDANYATPTNKQIQTP